MAACVVVSCTSLAVCFLFDWICCCSGCQLLSAQKTPAQIDGCFIGTEQARQTLPRRTPFITNTKISATSRATGVFSSVSLIRSLLNALQDTSVKQEVTKGRIPKVGKSSSLDEERTAFRRKAFYSVQEFATADRCEALFMFCFYPFTEKQEHTFEHFHVPGFFKSFEDNMS